tara:strand:- start:83 stop:598 length:516 start_codon:yes stop_codon:yes gene_type:complete
MAGKGKIARGALEALTDVYESIGTVAERMNLEDAGMGLTEFANDDIILSGGVRTGSSAPGLARLRYDVYDWKKIEAGTPIPEAKLGTTDLNLKLGKDNQITDTIEGLINIDVDKNQQGSGVGTRIVKNILANADDGLKVYDIKKQAKGFWESLGAEISGSRGFIPKKTNDE